MPGSAARMRSSVAIAPLENGSSPSTTSIRAVEPDGAANGVGVAPASTGAPREASVIDGLLGRAEDARHARHAAQQLLGALQPGRVDPSPAGRRSGSRSAR